MHIYPNSIGAINPDGTTAVEAEVCALTGLPVLNEHHTYQGLGDGVHYVRVLSQQYPKLTDSMKAELLASVTPKKSSTKAVETAKE